MECGSSLYINFVVFGNDLIVSKGRHMLFHGECRSEAEVPSVMVPIPSDHKLDTEKTNRI